MESGSIPGPILLIGTLVALSLAPFVAMMVTSYVKIVVVLSLVRQALGIQQIPPNIVLNGIAIILSFYIMNPVVQSTFEIVRAEKVQTNDLNSIANAAKKASQPIRDFMMKHTPEKERAFFLKSAQAMWPKERTTDLRDDDLMILTPAFTVSQLTTAFQIGFLLYLPFIVIDLIVSNVLLALGMMMVSPMTISLPLKLLLFVAASGWTRLIHGLVLTYA
jgi:type III secretion protein R